MTIYRIPPRCTRCGEYNMKQVNYPMPGEGYIGDNFSHWEPIPCKCKETHTK